MSKRWPRLPLSKADRFEVFKRDEFTCQYCGRTTPDVTLQVDHVLAVANGGTNDRNNLVTSCVECNAGKSSSILNRPPADTTAIILRLRKVLARLDPIQLSYVLGYAAGIELSMGPFDGDSVAAADIDVHLQYGSAETCGLAAAFGVTDTDLFKFANAGRIDIDAIWKRSRERSKDDFADLQAFGSVASPREDADS